ncbi:MAG: alpha/beta fold hydrolase [Gammaproteobacteria bacterium]|nr:alpha/beta fold hydrolase [Gammaproteobacteria bacterium]
MSTQFHEGTAYEINGQGPDVVLIHGLGLNRHMWQWLISDLRPHYRVITYDILGHGESKNPESTPRLSQYANQLARLLERCDSEDAAVAGFSLGGMIGRRFALDYPNKLSELTIISSAHDRTEHERAAVLKRVKQARESGPSATVEAALQRWFTPDYAGHNPDVMNLIREWVMANDPAIYPDIYRMMAEGDIELADTISAISCPVLVITGADDNSNSPEMAQHMAALMPNARVEIVPGLRHMGLVEAPEKFNQPLLEFFNGHVR